MFDGSNSLLSSSSMSWVNIAAFPFAAFGAGLGLPRTYLCVGVRGVVLGVAWGVGLHIWGALSWYSLVVTRYHRRPRCLPRPLLRYGGIG